MQALLPQKKYLNIKNIALYVVILLFYYVLNNAGIKQSIYPFAMGFFVCLIWCNQNKILNICFFCLSNFLTNFDFYFFLGNLLYSIILALIIFILKKKNKHILKWQYTIISSILLLIYVPIYIYIKTPLLNIFYTFLLGITFYLSINKCIKTILTKGINIKLNLDEIICFCFILIALGGGLSQINVINISLILPIGVFLIFISSLTCSTSAPLIIASCLGIGYTFNLSNLNYIAILTCFALCSIIFKNSKYYLCLSLIVVELLLGLYFKVYGSYSFLSFLFIIIPLVSGLLLPNKFYEKVSLFFKGNDTSFSSRNIILRSKKNISQQFLEISNALFEIYINFKNSIKKQLPKNEAKHLIEQELCKKVCLNCKNKYRCLTILKDHTLSTFDTIIDTAFQKEKITILDIPSPFTSQCNKINLITDCLNNFIVNYNAYLTQEEEKNNGKLLICESLDAFNKMFLKLSTDIQKNIYFDYNKEDQILEELNFKNIYVKDVVLTKKENNDIEISLLIEDKNIENPNLIKTLNKIFNLKFEIVNIQPSCYANLNIVVFKPLAKYSCIYGISGANKFGNTVSGDNFSCVKLLNNKVLFAICDGMGNGDRAKEHSSLTISLIENFYKAGFTEDSIIELVNKFITLNCEDVFSALDIALINLDTGKTDFIKLGAQESFIKEKKLIHVIEGDSLPLGIINNIKPSLNTHIITLDNLVLMCSDGAIDCIGLENLTNFLERTSTKNPQTLCDDLMDIALNTTNGKPKDDITIMAFKLCLN